MNVRDFKKGDRVVLSHPNGSRLTTAVESEDGSMGVAGFLIPGAGWVSYETSIDEGWAVTEHDRMQSRAETVAEICDYLGEHFSFHHGAVIDIIRDRFGAKA